MPDVKDRVSPVTVLAKSPLFSELVESELAFLAQRVVRRRFAADELIFSEGDPCPGMWIIESGLVKIFKSSASGREQILAIDGPGHAVAELPVFDGGPYPASALAVRDSVLLFASKQDFQALCVAHPGVALKILAVIGARLRGLVAIIEELSFTTVRGRLVSLLVRMAQQGQRRTEGIAFVLPASNQEIAAQIGTVRELVSRNFSRLQSEGVIRLEGRTVLVPDLRALESAADTP
jgi:CRP/FNR family transcriptional regulator, cyclic AMP receptor protein